MRLPSLLKAVGLVWALTLCLAASAQNWPTKPIRWIVPFPPGGSTDTFSRPVAAKLSEILGQPVVVENVPGAGASIGMDRVAKSAPDGYTIGLATTGTHAINPHLYGAKLPHDTSRDFTALTLAARYFNVLLVNPKLNINSVPELLAYAKANPDKVTFGSAGNGSSNHLSGEVLKLVTGLPMTHVPYRGAQEGVTALLGRQITMFADAQAWRPQVESGEFKLLSAWTPTRLGSAPNAPTLIELGFGMSVTSPYGIVGPKGMDPEITDFLHTRLKKALDDEACQAIARRWELPNEYLGPQAYLEFARERVAYERDTVRRLNLSID